MGNKVKFGLRNVYYAPVTVTAGVAAYSTPAAIPGGVSLTMDPKGDLVEFFADDSLYFNAESNQGYEGDLEVALIPDAFRTGILKEKAGASGALFEDADAVATAFALLFEFSGDVEHTRHVFYNVTAARPTLSGKTKESSIEVQTESLSITASPAVDSRIVKGKFKPADTGYDAFFTTVQVYAPVV